MYGSPTADSGERSSVARLGKGSAGCGSGKYREGRSWSALPVRRLRHRACARRDQTCSMRLRPCRSRPAWPVHHLPGHRLPGFHRRSRHQPGKPGRSVTARHCVAEHYLPVALARDSTSSGVNIFPRLTPGHRSAAYAQLSESAILPGQKGQVRHWLGRRL